MASITFFMLTFIGRSNDWAVHSFMDFHISVFYVFSPGEVIVQDYGGTWYSVLFYSGMGKLFIRGGIFSMEKNKV